MTGAIPAPRRASAWPGRPDRGLPPLRLPAENPHLLTAFPMASTPVPQGFRLRTVDLAALAAPEQSGRPGCQILAMSREESAAAHAASDFESAVAQTLAMLAEAAS